ncbi:MAG: deoxyribose-phosphate aldolase [Bacteroides sp.]|nr:deoxyribose-phosphate aldolase [Eubacterium sp.]MCM1418867.1 deoxyribose-phosphate aldolase [Roseburia sp.]MCM1463332.1 deoxyribose-phosphate aldolase [Bacteroides sp.]
MTNTEIFSHVDHTRLAAVSTWEEIDQLCAEAIRYGAASVCIPPFYLEKAARLYPSLSLCTVIGFPLGYSTTEVKAFEAADAVKKGAAEIDMVINLCAVKNGDYETVKRDMEAVKAACNGRTLKVIVETCFLTEEEKIRLCRLVTEVGADYIKTSTGFGTGGATLEDVDLFRKNIGENVKIKAAGGIRTREEMEAFLSRGCDRIGTSGAVKALFGEGETGNK